MIAIIGAGPAGLTAAYVLSKNNIEVHVYEASNSVGGMCKTIKIWGQNVDLGPHRFFSNDTRVNSLWIEIIKKEYCIINRLTRIYYNKKFFFYPLKFFNVLFNLGLIKSTLCFFSFLYSKLFPPKKINNFENWITAKFGKVLFNIFFKSYSEKLWGLKCNKIHSDFAKQRIKKLTLFEAIKSSLYSKNNENHKTLVDEFAYPRNGTGMVYELMKKKIIKNGGKFFFNNKITKIKNIDDKKKISIIDKKGRLRKYDHMISTMPINYLIKNINAPKKIINISNSLKFRNTILVYLLLKNKNPFPDQWIYVHSSNIRTGRITNFKNWSKEINKNKKNTIICMEYWCNEDDNTWKLSDSDLINLAKNDVKNSELLAGDKILEGRVIKIPKCYPIYKTNYKGKIKKISEYLKTKKNISVIGRYGSFKYNNQDHSILMGLLAADNLINRSKNDLWNLNSDYEYQEKSSISKSGLKKIN
jgi:hypothetical protein